MSFGEVNRQFRFIFANSDHADIQSLSKPSEKAKIKLLQTIMTDVDGMIYYDNAITFKVNLTTIIQQNG